MSTQTTTVTMLPRVADVLGSALATAEVTRLADGLTAYVVQRPARLGLTAHRRIYTALVPVTTQSFGADMTPYWAQRSKEGYLERLAEFVLVAGADDTMIGWTGFHVLPDDDRTLIYLDSTGMVPDSQSRGVMRRLMHDRIHGTVLPSCAADRPVYLTARSESPVFYRLMRGLFDTGTLFPHATLAVPADVAQTATTLAGWLGQSHLFNPSTLAVENAYDGLDELYGELPTTGDPDLDQLFRERLGPLDAYLLTGRVR